MTTPLSAAYYQSSENTPMKAGWTSVLGSRAFLDVMVGNWWNFFPLRPVNDYGLYDGPWGPGRVNLANSQIYDGGANNGYQDQKRWKPQGYVSLSYFKDGWGGSHDFKVGFDIKRDRRSLFRDQPFDIFYRDNGAALSQIDIYNTDVTGINDVVNQAVWLNDTWKLTNRLTVNLGLRYEHYLDQWPEQEFAPNGIPALAGWNDQQYQDFIAPRTVEERTVANTHDVSPRVGFAYDLTGDNRTVVKAYYGASRWNSADELADKENPVGIAQLRYAFLDCSPTRTTLCDLNGNRLLDSPAELGAFNTTLGGAGFVRIDRDLNRPVTHEISTNVEREIVTGLSARVSYVFKGVRDIWGEDDPIRNGSFTIPISIVDPGPDNVLNTGDEQTINTFDRPATIGQDRVYTNPEGYDADFNTVEVALNRRFSGKWMMLTSAGYTWSKMLHVSNLTTPTPTGYTRFYSLPAGRQALRRRVRARDLHHVELQGHRPLRDAVGHRHLGLVARAERPALRPHDRAHLPGRRRARVPRRADHGQPLRHHLDLRPAARQVVHPAGPGRADHLPARRLQPAEQRRDHGCSGRPPSTTAR